MKGKLAKTKNEAAMYANSYTSKDWCASPTHTQTDDALLILSEPVALPAGTDKQYYEVKAYHQRTGKTVWICTANIDVEE